MMGLFDNASDSESNPAVPGGNLTKPLMIALLALLASRYFGGGKEAPASAPPDSTSTSPASLPDVNPTAILGGLGGLLKELQQKGLGDTMDSWIKTGPNKSVAPDQISNALGPELIDALAQRTGLSKEQIGQILSQTLPRVVDQLTPEGRLPNREEIARLIG